MGGVRILRFKMETIESTSRANSVKSSILRTGKIRHNCNLCFLRYADLFMIYKCGKSIRGEKNQVKHPDSHGDVSKRSAPLRLMKGEAFCHELLNWSFEKKKMGLQTDIP